MEVNWDYRGQNGTYSQATEELAVKFCERSIPAKGRRRAWCGSWETGGPSISGEHPGTEDRHSAPEILSLTGCLTPEKSKMSMT